MSSTASVPSARDTVINLRVRTAQRDLIDRAARASGKTRSEFMLEAAREKAENVILDRTFFALDATGFKRFVAALDATPTSKAAVAGLLKTRAPWDR